MSSIDQYINKVICGDAYSIVRELPDKSIDVILTDPPYKMKMGVAHPGVLLYRQYTKAIEDNDLHNGFNLSILDDYARVLRKFNFITFCSKEQIRDYLNWIYRHNFNWMLFTWHKTNPIPATNNTYLPDTEYIFHMWEKGVGLSGDYYTKKRYWIQPIIHNNFDHPTVKPLNIVRDLLTNAMRGEDIIVLDPFCGTGTTALACIQLGCKYICIDEKENYCDIANNRIYEQQTNNIVVDNGIEQLSLEVI